MLHMLRQKLVDIALAEVGVKEEGGNNCGPRIREYQSKTWLKPGSWPWCAAFCCWVLWKWLQLPEVLAVIKDTTAPVFNAEHWRCQDASAFGWIAWAKKKGLQVLPPTVSPEPGDFVVYDFNGAKEGGGHIGIVVDNPPGAPFSIVEGNTNVKGARESETGDGVWKKDRLETSTTIKAYIRII